MNRRPINEAECDAAVVAAAQGNDGAFRQLVVQGEFKARHHLRKIFEIKDEELDDVFQDVFKRAWMNAGNCRGVNWRMWYAWYFTIARRATLTYLKKRKRTPRTNTVAESAGDSSAPVTGHWVRDQDASPATNLARKDAEEALSLAMASLSSTDQHIIRRHCLERAAFGEIASEVNQKEATVRQRYFRARQRLRDELGSEHNVG